jgi:serine/alanine racemase
VLSLRARIIHINSVHTDESVGYGMAYIAQRESKIGILPIGYADGIPRSLSCGKAEVLIHGQRVPIIGRICMDQLAIDLTDIADVAVGDVTIIGKDGNDELISADVADHAGSISNELLSRMGKRLKIIATV